MDTIKIDNLLRLGLSSGLQNIAASSVCSLIDWQTCLVNAVISSWLNSLSHMLINQGCEWDVDNSW